MRPHPIATCSKTLAANASTHPLDVVKMKSALGALGHYAAPDWGVSQFPDAALFDAIKRFQKSQGLKTDGAIKPGGETEAALSQALIGADGEHFTMAYFCRSHLGGGAYAHYA